MNILDLRFIERDGKKILQCLAVRHDWRDVPLASVSSAKSTMIPIATNQDLIVDEIRAERQRQDETWGPQNHDAFRWLSILTEEVGEAAQAANDVEETCEVQHWARYREELIQVAAVAIAMIECLDRN